MFTAAVKSETYKLLLIALPLTAAYLAELAMFITTKMVVGKLGYVELATVGITSSLSFEILVIAMGLLSIVGVLCAQADGAKRKRDAGLAARQGFIISLALGVPATALIWNLDFVLSVTGQDPRVVTLSKPYLQTLSPFVLPVLFFAVLRNFVTALGRPNIIMIITVISVAVNYVLTVWFVHGGLGLPAMGIAGAGLAVTLVSWLMFFWLLWYVYKTKTLRGYGLFADRWRFDRRICREILVLGIPVAGLVFLEAGMFTAASILSGAINAETLAAFEVVVAWAGIPFVMSLGLAEGAMVRVAHGVGRGEINAARTAGMIGMLFGAILLGLLMVVPLMFSSSIIGIFIAPSDPGFTIVAGLATQFLFIAAFFQVFDGLQAIAARALRGIKDNTVPLWIAGIGYWVFGIGGGALLAFGLNWNGLGIWWGMAMGLCITGTLLAWRFHSLTRKLLSRPIAN